MHTYKDFRNITDLKKELMLFCYDNLEESEKSALSRSYVLNEGFIDSISDKGRKVLSKICNSVSDIIQFLDKIKKDLYQHLEIILTTTKDKLKAKLKADGNFIKVVKNQINT